MSVGPYINYNILEIWSTAHPDYGITETRNYATPGLIEAVEHNATGKLDSTKMHDE